MDLLLQRLHNYSSAHRIEVLGASVGNDRDIHICLSISFPFLVRGVDEVGLCQSVL